jgi:hypothetical protein
MSAWARVGAKCVHAIYQPLVTGQRVAGAVYPEEGGVYTIRKIVFCSRTGNKLLLLREIDNRHICAKLGLVLEPAFNALHFKPLAYKPQSPEHDVEQFNRIARHVSTPEKERA